MPQAMRQPFVFALVAPPFHDLRATGTGKGDLDQHLAGLEQWDFQFGDDERLSRLDQDRSFRLHAFNRAPE